MKKGMKKKIIALALVAALGASAAIGGSLAFFTDTDAQTNTFTTGNVAIDLYEDFGDNDANGIEGLIPATGSAQAGTLKNGIEKEVYVQNTGSEAAYVRVHIAIPAILDNGRPDFDASKNVLHFNYTDDSIGKDRWDWSKTAEDGVYEGNWNFYTTSINGKAYNVYVVTYGTALAYSESTFDAMHQVYLDSKVTNEDITKIKAELGDEWKIYVAAEGTQAQGFDNAFDALNASFGTPGTNGYVAPAFLATSEGKTFMEVGEAVG